jgi:uncharacterized protein
MSTELELASWRRSVGELYTAVRAEDDPQYGHALWRHGRDELFRSHPQSPLLPGDPLRQAGLPYWPYDPRLRFDVPLLQADRDMTLSVPTSEGVTPMIRLGRVHLAAPVDAMIDVWWLRQYAGGLFLPLRDGTAGESSYGGGRYVLDTAKGADLGGQGGRLIIDLNFLYHPSCRYNDAWLCPLAPLGNTIGTRVSAGECLPARALHVQDDVGAGAGAADEHVAVGLPAVPERAGRIVGRGYCSAMSRIPYLRRDELGPEGQQLWDAIVNGRSDLIVTADGGLAGPFNAFVTAPGAGRRMSSLGATLRFYTSIERRLSEIAIITVGARWRAEFEWFAHAPMAREHGVSGAVVDAIGRGEEPPFQADDERAVYAVARQLSTSGRVERDAYDAAHAFLGDAGMVELVSLCGYYTLISFLLNAFDVPLPPGAAPTWDQS